jgi:hypothetical protein
MAPRRRAPPEPAMTTTPSLRGGETDEAIQDGSAVTPLDCFAALAMTAAADTTVP